MIKTAPSLFFSLNDKQKILTLVECEAFCCSHIQHQEINTLTPLKFLSSNITTIGNRPKKKNLRNIFHYKRWHPETVKPFYRTAPALCSMRQTAAPCSQPSLFRICALSEENINISSTLKSGLKTRIVAMKRNLQTKINDKMSSGTCTI